MIGAMSGVVDGPTHDVKYDFKLLSDGIMQIRTKVGHENGEFLSYFYPFFYIQYRFLWSEGEPHVSI